MPKILVIDDEQPLLVEILDALSFEGYVAIGAANGRIGVQLAHEHLPDLIISDITMPELDGYGVLASLRANPATTLIPVIFLTAKAERSNIREGIELGAQDYLTKPFTAAELLGAIKARLTEKETIAEHYEQKLVDLRTKISQTLPHELRTPLFGILGFAELLTMETDHLDRSQIRAMAGSIHSGGQRLHRLVENYLLFAQTEMALTESNQNRSSREHRVTNPGEIISTMALTQARLAERDADLLSRTTDEPIRVSEPDLKKITEELIGNAFKFSEAGTPVNVATTTLDNIFTLQIEDAGRGMTPEQIAEIGAFMQFDRNTYEQQGSGLGLVIAKRLAEMHGGTFIIESAPYQGTKVTVKLQIAESSVYGGEQDGQGLYA